LLDPEEHQSQAMMHLRQNEALAGKFFDDAWNAAPKLSQSHKIVPKPQAPDGSYTPQQMLQPWL